MGGLPSLRGPQVVERILESFRAGCERPGFRLVEFSIQHDHLHAIVEADGAPALGRGMKSLAARFARAVNRALRRSGPVLRDRYHLHVLRSAREVRNALGYVLTNFKRHLARVGLPVDGIPWVDAASSARWFRGWKAGFYLDESRDPPPVAAATSWLLRSGWQKHGLLDPARA
jgi:REP element-mobilizing transposase RayT